MFKALLVILLLFVSGCMEIVKEEEQQELDLKYIKQSVLLSRNEMTAFVNVGNYGIYIIDISDTRNPKLIKRYKTDASVYSISLKDNTLFSANDKEGVEILDVSDPYDATTMAYLNIKDELARSVRLSEDSSKLAVGTNKGVVLFDATNLSYPQYLGRYDTNGSIKDIRFSKDSKTLFLANFKYGLEILDIDFPSYPQRASSIVFEGNGCDLEFDKNFRDLFTASLTSALKVVDVEDRQRPEVKYIYDAHDVSMIWDIALGSNLFAKRVYLAKSERGFEIVDFKNPDDPKRVAFFDTNGTTRGVAVNRSETRVFVADGKEGFKIFDISRKDSPKKIGYLSW